MAPGIVRIWSAPPLLRLVTALPSLRRGRMSQCCEPAFCFRSRRCRWRLEKRMKTMALLGKDRRWLCLAYREDERSTVPPGERGGHLMRGGDALLAGLPERDLPGLWRRKVTECETELVHAVVRAPQVHRASRIRILTSLVPTWMSDLECGEQQPTQLARKDASVVGMPTERVPKMLLGTARPMQTQHQHPRLSAVLVQMCRYTASERWKRR